MPLFKKGDLVRSASGNPYQVSDPSCPLGHWVHPKFHCPGCDLVELCPVSAMALPGQGVLMWEHDIQLIAGPQVTATQARPGQSQTSRFKVGDVVRFNLRAVPNASQKFMTIDKIGVKSSSHPSSSQYNLINCPGCDLVEVSSNGQPHGQFWEHVLELAAAAVLRSLNVLGGSVYPGTISRAPIKTSLTPAKRWTKTERFQVGDTVRYRETAFLKRLWNQSPPPERTLIPPDQDQLLVTKQIHHKLDDPEIECNGCDAVYFISSSDGKKTFSWSHNFDLVKRPLFPPVTLKPQAARPKHPKLPCCGYCGEPLTKVYVPGNGTKDGCDVHGTDVVAVRADPIRHP